MAVREGRGQTVVQIKVCGITRAADAALSADLGAAALGFVFWPHSPRYLEPGDARAIVAALPPHVAAIGVFVDQPLDHVEDVARMVPLTAVQLHGHEPVAYCRALPYRVIKAVPMVDDRLLLSVEDVPAEMTVLLDAHDPVRMGGTGRPVDWAAAAVIARQRRVILSGGLRPDNVADAIAVVRPYGVDVSSGVEQRPGIKDPQRLRSFIEAVRQIACGSAP